MNIEKALEELLLFSNEILTLEKPVNVEKIIFFEEKYKCILPEDYKFLIKKYNGINLLGTIVYGIEDDMTPDSLEYVYNIEHFNVNHKMYSYLIPFSPDGAGNYYCFDIRYPTKDSCNIVFWQHDYTYSAIDAPEITNESFADWIKEVMIDWTLEDYDYNGFERD